MPTVPITANTLGQMKADIADELARPDLTTQIASKIAEAIDFYQPERFFFSESRDFLFSTTTGKEFYTEADIPGISVLNGFDYIILYIGSIPWPLARRTDVEIEVLNQNGLMRGQPWSWSYFNQQLRLGPVPDLTYQMRIACHQYVAPPANDNVTGNAWMTSAEKLIRSYAKSQLYLHVIRNRDMAAVMQGEADAAYDMLKGKTNKLVGRGIVAPMEF